MKPREKYLMSGPEGFGDAELLGLVLGTGCSGRSAVEIGREILAAVGGLGGVTGQPAAALARVKGVGPARAVRLHAALSLGKRAMVGPGDENVISRPEDAFSRFGPRLDGLAQEELHGLFLNRRNAVLAYHVLTRGNDSHTIVDPRQVFRTAILLGASGVLVAHNHPSGDPSPSVADVEVTSRLQNAGRLLGVELLDHLVVAGGRCRSLREEGLMDAGRPAVYTSLACCRSRQSAREGRASAMGG
jgi:DNA repair protein RadC